MLKKNQVNNCLHKIHMNYFILIFSPHSMFLITKYLIFTHNFYDIIVCEYLSYSISSSLPLREYNVGCLSYTVYQINLFTILDYTP